MIIYSLCNTCLQPYQLLIESSDIGLIQQIMDETGNTCECPRKCGGRINLVGDPTIEAMSKDIRLKNPLSISGKELYQAVNGLGLPDEVPKSTDTVSAILRAEKINEVSIGEIQERIYLHEIKMTGGITIHLGSGPYGAQILKMTKERI